MQPAEYQTTERRNEKKKKKIDDEKEERSKHRIRKTKEQKSNVRERTKKGRSIPRPNFPLLLASPSLDFPTPPGSEPPFLHAAPAPAAPKTAPLAFVSTPAAPLPPAPTPTRRRRLSPGGWLGRALRSARQPQARCTPLLRRVSAVARFIPLLPCQKSFRKSKCILPFLPLYVLMLK